MSDLAITREAQLVALPEIRTVEKLRDLLGRISELDIPAFIIKQVSGIKPYDVDKAIIDAEWGFESTGQFVHEVAYEPYSYDGTGAIPGNRLGISVLHRERVRSNRPLLTHLVGSSGSSDAFFINPNLDAFLDQVNYQKLAHLLRGNVLDDLIEQGILSSEYLDDVVYKTEFGEGDRLIFDPGIYHGFVCTEARRMSSRKRFVKIGEQACS